MPHSKHTEFNTPDNVDAKIWRFINIEKLCSLLKEQSLHFSKITTFEDPFEGTLPECNKNTINPVFLNRLKSITDPQERKERLKWLQNTSNHIHEMQIKSTLVNCWHLNEFESASMWKSYSPDKGGISIQSTYQKLSNSFNSTVDKIYIGTVKYEDFSKVWIPENNSFTPFLLKRKSFECESELRSITTLPVDKDYSKMNTTTTKHTTYTSYDSKINYNGVGEHGKFVKVNVDTLIEKIYIHPFAPREFEEDVRSLIKKLAPSLSSKIIKSKLYTLS